MTRSFFQNLEQAGVRYLLISGQATVLYGAAAFSEDIDLWVQPDAKNINALKQSLRASEAKFYKLTPDPNETLMLKGHGFHFVIGDEPIYLDIMGKPPRVGDFAAAQANSQMFDTDWGVIPVIGLKELVEVKKTQRLEDYAIISKLAVEWLNRPECASRDEDLRWALENIFTLEQLDRLCRERGERVAQIGDAAISTFAKIISDGSQVPVELENDIETGMQQRLRNLQRADREYWRAIIADLRRLKSENLLQSVASPV
jgi:hypothetical protein